MKKRPYRHQAPSGASKEDATNHHTLIRLTVLTGRKYSWSKPKVVGTVVRNRNRLQSHDSQRAFRGATSQQEDGQITDRWNIDPVRDEPAASVIIHQQPKSVTEMLIYLIVWARLRPIIRSFMEISVLRQLVRRNAETPIFCHFSL